MAAVVEPAASVPELPFASDQLTGLFAVKPTVPFSPAKVADGVIARPPLVTAATPGPVIATTVGEPGWFPLIDMLATELFTAVGLNVVEIVQLAPEGTVLPQVVDMRKSLASPPASEISDNDR